MRCSSRIPSGSGPDRADPGAGPGEHGPGPDGRSPGDPGVSYTSAQCPQIITQADIDASQPYVISQPGRYCLVENIQVSYATYGNTTIVISASDVTLNFNRCSLTELNGGPLSNRRIRPRSTSPMGSRTWSSLVARLVASPTGCGRRAFQAPEEYPSG